MKTCKNYDCWIRIPRRESLKLVYPKTPLKSHQRKPLWLHTSIGLVQYKQKVRSEPQYLVHLRFQGKYHRNPISLDWDSILQGEAHRQAFLKDLAYSLESSFGETGTGASLVEVKNYLSYNDYSYTQINHNNNLVIGSLSNQRPVYMEGDRERENERPRSGHAQVCDGYRSSSSNFTYILKIISPADPLFYETADSYSTSTARSQGLHMNWGWGGTNNGYYHDSVCRFNSFK